jgi:hypothetical protein
MGIFTFVAYPSGVRGTACLPNLASLLVQKTFYTLIIGVSVIKTPFLRQ